MRNSVFISENPKSLSTVIFVVVLLLSFWFYSSTRRVDDKILKLEISENEEIFLDGKQTAFNDFQQTTTNLISQYESQGISKDHVVIAIRADKKLNLGVIFDLQKQLKDCGLNKLIYEQ